MYTKINIDMGGIALVDEPMAISAKRCSDGNGTLSYLFFSEEWVDIQRAKAICSKCTGRAECLRGALERGAMGCLGRRRTRNGANCRSASPSRQATRQDTACRSNR